jgi:hypothetical protein
LASNQKRQLSVEQVIHTLLNFCVNRDELKGILGRIPMDAGIDRVAVEYELQLLKIVSVGWGLLFFLENDPMKEALSETFWNGVQVFSGAISSLATNSIGKEVDYFEVLKARLSTYVNALEHFPDVADPAAVVGPTFAMICGSDDHPEVISAGRRVFSSSLAGVGHYLDSVEILEDG